jgi:aldehyde dehydrogenase (NAD+)
MHPTQHLDPLLKMTLSHLEKDGFRPPLTNHESGQRVWIPTTGTVFSHLESPIGYEDAMQRAQKASYEIRSKFSGRQIGGFLTQFAALVEQHRSTIAALLTCLNKTTREANVEITEAADVIKMNASRCYEEKGTLYSSDKKNEELQVRWVPLGDVSGQLGVCNFPVSITLKHVLPSLSVGVAQIVKGPDVGGALVTLYLKHLFDKTAVEYGFPKDAFIVMVGGRDLGEKMAKDSRFCTIAATGSNQMVKSVRMAVACHGGKTVLEGSGHNIVLAMFNGPNSDSAKLFEQAIFNTMGGMGALRCSTAHTIVSTPKSRLFVSELLRKAYDRFQHSIGDPQHPDTVMTPLYSPEHLDQFQADVQANQEIGGVPQLSRLNIPKEYKKGFWPTPALLTFPDGSMDMKPVYGPSWNVVTLSEQEIWHFLKIQSLGLTNAIFTDDSRLVRQFLLHSQSGVCNVNTPTNGNPIGTIAGFVPGTPTSGGSTSLAGSILGWQAYARPIFTREGWLDSEC